MAALTGNSVGSSYQSLLKTTDNGAIGATLKKITDGLGNDTPLSMGSNYIQLSADTIELIEPTGGTNLMMIDPTQVTFEGTVNFTNATVIGIGGGGGSTPAPFVSYATGGYDGSAQGPYTFFNNRLALYPVLLEAGQELTTLDFEITTAFASATLEFAIFDMQKTASAVSPALVPKDNIASLGSVSGTTTGIKTLTGFTFTPTYTGVYFIAVLVPGVWDGAFGGYNSNSQIGGSTIRAFDNLQQSGVQGSFYGQFAPFVQPLIDTTATIPSTYAASKGWSSTSARIFVDVRTN